MFILDSLMIAGLRWVLDTTVKAAEAEMNDDSVLREQLLEAEMRREMGEISDEEFGRVEADLLARIREIKERREGSGPLAFGAEPLETSEHDRFQVEASVSGDFHDPAAAPHTTILEPLPHHHALGHLIETSGTEEIEILDMQAGDAAPPPPPPRRRAAAPRPAPRRARSASGGSGRAGGRRRSGPGAPASPRPARKR
jgi:Gas vesicle protein G